MTIREYLNQMSDEDFAHWLCLQMWPDYCPDSPIGLVRYNAVRNYLKSELKEGEEWSK